MLNPKNDKSFRSKHETKLLILAIVFIISLVFALAIAITPHSYYTSLGEL